MSDAGGGGGGGPGVAGGGGSSSGGGSRIGGGGGGGGSARPGPASVTESLAQAPAPEVDPDDAAPGSGEPRPETAVDKKEIHTHKLPWQAYALASSNRKGSRWSYRYAVGSFIEDYCNKVQVVQLMEDTAEFKTRATFDHPYPATKIMWAPKGLAKTKDLLATTGDYLRIWELQETGDDSEDSARMVSLLNNSKRSEYCAPLTSFDWNDIDQNQLATSSIDTTVAVWDIETEKVKKLLQAHDKEVYDVAFARHRDIFATVGADGSMRLFDLRTLEYSTIVCETTDLVPMLRVAWNKIDTNFLAACALDKRYVAIVDIRLPATPVAELQAHNAPVTGVAWASHSASHLVSCADDGQALIWDLAPVPRDVEDPILAYSAGAEINNLIWPSAAPEWVVITFDNKIQVLRV